MVPYQPSPQPPAGERDGDKWHVDSKKGLPGKIYVCGPHRAKWALLVLCFSENPSVIIWTVVSSVEDKE